MPYLDPLTGQPKTDAYGNPLPDVTLPPPPPGMPAPQAQTAPPPAMDAQSLPTGLPAATALGSNPNALLPPVPRLMPGLPAQAPLQPSPIPAQFAPSTTATDAYARDVASVPKTPIWQKLGAMALGGAAGYANAGGRVHIDPNAINSATSNILYPGRAAELARLKTAAGIELQSNAQGLAAQKAQSDVSLDRAHIAYWNAAAAKALQDPAKVRVMRVGNRIAIVGTDGSTTFPPMGLEQVLEEKAAMAEKYGLKPDTPEYQQYVLGVTRHDPPEKAPARPVVVAPGGTVLGPDNKPVFTAPNRPDKPPAESKPAGRATFGNIEVKKQTALRENKRRADDAVRKMRTDASLDENAKATQEQSIRASEEDAKTQIQSGYLAEIEAVGGNPASSSAPQVGSPTLPPRPEIAAAQSKSGTAPRIKVRLADGRTGSVDRAEFNPKTMTEIFPSVTR